MMKRLISIILAAVSLGCIARAEDIAVKTPIPFGLDLDINAEYRWAPGGIVLVEGGTQYMSGIDLERDYFDIPPLARLAMGAGGPQGLSVAIETTFRPQWTGNWGAATNLPYLSGNKGFENYFLTRGVAYWRSPDFSVAFGRDPVDYGGILYGSLLPSTRLPYLDNIRMQGKLGSFTADWMAATIPAVMNWQGANYDVNPNQGDSNGGTDYFGWQGDSASANPTSIIEVLNRYSWTIHDFVIGVSDHAMIARRNNCFDITDFLPMASRHQTADAQTNNSLIFDAAWHPIEGLKLAAQYGLDDIDANFIGIPDTSAPTMPAFVAGAEYRGRTTLGALSAYGEVGYTHWDWGNYSGNEMAPDDVDPLMRMQYRYDTVNGALLLPLTSPYGPGALWFQANVSQDIGTTGLNVGAQLLLLQKNEGANLINYSDYLYPAGTTTPVVVDSDGYLGIPECNGPYVYFGQLSFPVTFTYSCWQVVVSPSVICRNWAWSGEVDFVASYHLRSGDHSAVAVRPWAAPY
jgi:hypothetical protein